MHLGRFLNLTSLSVRIKRTSNCESCRDSLPAHEEPTVLAPQSSRDIVCICFGCSRCCGELKEKSKEKVRVLIFLSCCGKVLR